MARRRLGEGRAVEGEHLASRFLGDVSMHAIRVADAPYLVLGFSRKGAPTELTALTVAPNGMPDAIQGQAEPSTILPFGLPSPGLVEAVARGRRKASLDREEVRQLVRQLTVGGTRAPSLAGFLMRFEGADAAEAVAFADEAGPMMAEAGFPKPFRDAMSALRLVRTTDVEFRRALFCGPDAFRAFCLEQPFLADARWRDALEASEAGLSPLLAALDVSDGVARPIPVATARKLAGTTSFDFAVWGDQVPYEPLTRLMAAVPTDWMPRDAKAREAFGMVSVAASLAQAMTGVGLDVIVASSKGDWPGFRERCAARVMATDESTGLNNACRNLRDYPQHMSARLVAPFLAHMGREESPGAALALACDLAYGGRSLPSILEASRDWHAALDGIDGMLPDHVPPDQAWDVPFEAGAIDGYEFVPLRTGREITEEGSSQRDRLGVPGLSHCVGSYRAAARQGKCHIVSVRQADGELYRRIATLELDQSEAGPARIVQFCGHRNDAPPGDVVRAAGRYAALARPAHVPSGDDCTDEVSAACGYDWRDASEVAQALAAFQPLLPRKLRGLTLDGFAEALGIERSAAPAP